MVRISYVNGDYVEHSKAYVHIDDRGLLFSDGVYEVISVKKGTLIDWRLHFERLERSLNGLQISMTMQESKLYDVITKLLKKNLMHDSAMVYLQITRGVAPRNHNFPVGVAPSLVATVAPLPAPKPSEYEHGVTVISHPDLRWQRRDIKSLSLLPNVLAKQKASEAGAAEAVLVESSGIVTECSTSNFYIVDKKNIVRTHPANEHILGGITRAGLLSTAKESGIKIVEKPFKLDDVYSASEAFITSTTKYILPVTKIDGRTIGSGNPGKVTRQLMEKYAHYIERQV